ncbi:MAG: hypothetical protein SLAVMIC_00710 [uncultured marine phage]|uniref:Uncharacterized protein n=1 Tax=uncultured marine phage TaxID=707152 RepID=A0A8D9C9C6_9VIRU|nr:MAG: hypothetical protein SLAVMIC_00710 [uncultured marine phage]
MMLFLTISVFVLLGLLIVGGLVGLKYYKSFKKKLKEKDGEVDQYSKDLIKSNTELDHFYTLCDHRVGLWSTKKSIGYGNTKNFDIEVIITDVCEGRSKIKIIEVILTSGRWDSQEEQIKTEYDGTWVDSSEIKELSNSKILTREKRMSKLLDN